MREPAVAVPRRAAARRPGWMRRVIILAGVSLLGALVWRAGEIAYWGWRVRADGAALQSLASARDLSALAGAGPQITAARQHVEALRRAAEPLLWLTPLLQWMPVYGADLAAGRPLLDLARSTLAAADEAYTGLAPLLSALAAEDSGLTPEQALALVTAARPRLEAAQAEVEAALAARAQIQSDALSPQTRRLVERTDMVLPLLQPGLALAQVAPDLLGSAGSRTYLLLIQNEDELRATGGFISAVGTVTVAAGRLTAFTLEDYTAVDDLSLYYPLPPEPLQRYMGASLWLLRDANWSPDFPFSAALAAELYTAARRQPVDGVVALDQAALRLVLQAVGPVTLAEAPEPVGAANVVDYMRAAWSPAPGQGVTAEWWQHRKDFMRRLALAILDRLSAVSPLALGQAARQALDERHILVWLKEPQAAAALAELGWDGALRRDAGDYLLVVDSNLGFNKVNAVVQTELDYTVDLSAPATPTATLTVAHFNPAQGTLPCRQWVPYTAESLTGYTDLVRRCYWDYLRVYTPAGASLISATLQTVPGEWMLSGQPVPGTVEIGREKEGFQSFETFLVTPFETRQVTTFTYQLAPRTLVTTLAGWVYTLYIQKQSGVSTLPVRLAVELPPGATVVSATPAGTVQVGQWRLEMRLTQAVRVRLVFRLP